MIAQTQIERELEALNNSIEFFKLTDFSIWIVPETDKRITKAKYVLCEPSAENKPNGITGRLNYQEMNHFIRGYGMAIASQRTESGLLPAQLIEQRNELLDALKTLLKQARQDSFELDKSVSDTPAEEKAALVIRKIEKT